MNSESCTLSGVNPHEDCSIIDRTFLRTSCSLHSAGRIATGNLTVQTVGPAIESSCLKIFSNTVKFFYPHVCSLIGNYSSPSDCDCLMK